MTKGRMKRSFLRVRERQRHYSDAIALPSAPADLVDLMRRLTRKERILIKLRMTGAQNANGGISYERQYAVHRIIGCALSWFLSSYERVRDPRETHFDATLPVFLDDLVIRHADGSHTFVQAKDWAASPWEEVLPDLLRQASLARRSGTYGRTTLELVVSRSDVHKELVAAKERRMRCRLIRRSWRRRRIKDLTKISLVLYPESQVPDPEEYECLMSSSAEEHTRLDFPHHVHQAWLNAGRRGNLYDLMERVSRLSSYRTLTLDPDDALPADIDAILRAVPGLEPRLQSGRLHIDVDGLIRIFEFKFGSPRWKAFEVALRLARPTNTLQLREALRGI